MNFLNFEILIIRTNTVYFVIIYILLILFIFDKSKENKQIWGKNQQYYPLRLDKFKQIDFNKILAELQNCLHNII